MYDIETTNGDLVNGIVSDKKPPKIVRKNSFIIKLTTNIYSSLSKINTRYYLKFRKLIMHRQFFRIISHISEYVKTHCNDLNKPFQFAVHKWMINQ